MGLLFNTFGVWGGSVLVLGSFGQKSPQKSLANFDVDFGSIFDQIWDHLGAQNPSQIEQISSSELQTSKIDKPLKTTVYLCFFKVWVSNSHFKIVLSHHIIFSKIFLNSYCVSDSILTNLGAVLEPLFGHFGALWAARGNPGVVLVDFGYRLVSNLGS